MHYAGIGTRSPTKQQWELCYRVGRFMARHGWILHTGAAVGSDQAFAQGALEGGGRIALHLPWKGFEDAWVDGLVATAPPDRVRTYIIGRNDHEAHAYVKRLHPSPQSLGRAFPLMARNVRILKPDWPCKFVVAARSPFGEETGRGGTEFGCTLAVDLNIMLLTVRDIMSDKDATDLKTALKQQISKAEQAAQKVAEAKPEPVQDLFWKHGDSPLKTGLDAAFPSTTDCDPVLRPIIDELKRAVLKEETVDCPCCNQRAAIYKRTLNAGMAKALIWFVRQRLRHGETWIKIKDVPKSEVELRGGDYGKLAHWGLIEQPEDGKAGQWRATKRGVRFVKNSVDVPKQVFLYNNCIVGWSSERVSIIDVLGTAFDLADITRLGDPNEQREAGNG